MGYSTVARVRELSGLVGTEFINSSNDHIYQTNREFVAVNAVYFDGGIRNDWYTKRPKTIGFSVSNFSPGYVIQVDYDLVFTDTQIQAYIDEVDAVIEAYLNDVFPIPFLVPYPAIISSLSSQLATAKVLQGLAAKLNRTETNELASTLRAEALETIGQLQKGELTITDIDSKSKTSINVSTKGKKKVFRTRPDLNETWHEFHDAFDRDEGQDYGNGDHQSTSS